MKAKHRRLRLLPPGRAKLTVVSTNGKEATITLLTAGDFIGEESIAGILGLADGIRHRHHRLHRTQNRQRGHA